MKLIPISAGREKAGARPKYNGQYFAQVDDADYEMAAHYNWTLAKSNKYIGTVYAKKYIDGKCVYLHRFIMGVTDPNIKIDHIDHNGLNNQKDNLRKCTHSQNQMNKKPRGSSIYLGVNKHLDKWRAAICINGKTKHLGLFTDEALAAKAYDKAAITHHKEFANLNFQAK